MADFNKIAKKWQKKWEKDKIFQVESDKRKKYYIAIVYPYMSGLLHLGHLFTYTSPEIMARYKRMNNFNVLSKFGFHCTGTPIVAAAQKVKEKEPQQIETLKKMGISNTEISKFADPEYWCDYFPKETIKDLKNMGFALDYRYTFRTTSLNPPYDAMITWQFNRLKEKNLVKKGRHPVIWCPKDNMPVGDHDRHEGEGETPQEYVIFKQKLDNGKFILTATLRPDTVLGVTNLFIHPEIEYAEAKSNGETWILSKQAVARLTGQGYDLKITGKIKGKELIGKKAEEFDKSQVPILPAFFLNENVGTGIVHSCPSDSPDDLIALRDLQKDKETCSKYNLDMEEIKKIKPKPVLNTEGYGDIPAEKMLEKYKITSQKQKEKLEKIKKEIYTISFYKSKFNDRYKNIFSINLEGKPVQEFKDLVQKEIIEAGFAIPYYEPTGKVICRCLTECIVKIVEDQWFIEYNDPKWKKLAYKCLKDMQIYPEKIRKQFEHVIDWLDHWACTREFGLGTKLPWDRKWVIESLSDSTIQMAYCTISKYLENPREYGFKTDKLNDSFFDYVFLGKGKAKDVEKSTEIPKKTLNIMKKDFEYWYPYDFRNSAKDLIQNHLTFSIFIHTALFPKKHWPKAFIINGRIMVNNEKMSKSKGNFFTMRELYEKHSPDIVRLAAANAGEGAEDANYDMQFLETAKQKLKEIYGFIQNNHNKGRQNSLNIDKWFESKINESIIKTTDSLNNMMFKSAVQHSFLDLHRNLKWYLKRTSNNPNKKSINFFIETLIKLLTPFTPHFCEECWELIGKKSYVSNEKWPTPKKSSIKPELDHGEKLIKNTISDIREVLKLAKIENPKSILLFISQEWKHDLFKKANKLSDKGKNSKEIIAHVMKDPKFRKHGKEIMKFLPKMINDRKIPKSSLDQKQELKYLKEASGFIKKEFDASIEVIESEKSQENKAKQALPGKPAILID